MNKHLRGHASREGEHGADSKCEKPLGPSRYTGDATQRSSDQGMDRSSPLQFTVCLAESDSHNVGTDSEDSI
jgi:hypothetical protein